MKQIIITIAFIIFSFTVCHTQDLGIKWVEVQGGSFTMGSGNSAHQFTISGFHMSATEVTFDQYDTYCNATGTEKPDDEGWGRGNRPVIKVSWDDAIGFCRWLSKEIGSEVRLPNEAEWKFAVIGGSKSKGFTYSGSNNWKEVFWSEGNSDKKTQPVGLKKFNELGLYDMSGNIWEWCMDLSVSDGNRIGSDLKRPLCGNSFDNPASDPRQSIVQIERDARHDNVGFRIIKTK